MTSVSLGVRGVRLTFGRRGRRATIGLPGSGLSYTAYEPYNHRQPPMPAARQSGGVIIVVLIVAAIAALVFVSGQ